MRVLVTGHRGLVGRAVAAALERAGDAVAGFDRRDGQDVLDPAALARAAAGCGAVVHLAAELTSDDPARTLNANVSGTWNVLAAAERAGARRVAVASSVNALGVFMGEGRPDVLPISDDHPCRPVSAYGTSKRLMEVLCAAFTARSGIATFCLRPPAVLDDAALAARRAEYRADPGAEFRPYWEYGAFLHVDDLADAIAAALRCPDPPGGHAALLLCASDLGSARPEGGRALAAERLPEVPWRGGAAHDRELRLPLVDDRRARALLGWAPRRGWASREAV